MRTWEIDAPTKLSFDTVTSLAVTTFRGVVNVVGTDGAPTIEVSRQRGRPLRITDTDGRIEIRHGTWSKGLWRWLLGLGRHGPVDLTIAIPRDCPVRLDMVASGGIVSGLRSKLKLRSVSGSITVANVSGAIEAHSVSGSIEAHRVSAGLRAETVSGDVLIVGAGSDVFGKTVSGAITVDFEQPVAGDYVKLATVSGDITIRVPEDASLETNFHSTSGQISTAFDHLERADMPGMHFAQGVIAGGRAKLWASSTSGHIALLRRQPSDEDGDPA